MGNVSPWFCCHGRNVRVNDTLLFLRENGSRRGREVFRLLRRAMKALCFSQYPVGMQITSKGVRMKACGMRNALDDETFSASHTFLVWS